MAKAIWPICVVLITIAIGRVNSARSLAPEGSNVDGAPTLSRRALTGWVPASSAQASSRALKLFGDGPSDPPTDSMDSGMEGVVDSGHSRKGDTGGTHGGSISGDWGDKSGGEMFADGSFNALHAAVPFTADAVGRWPDTLGVRDNPPGRFQPNEFKAAANLNGLSNDQSTGPGAGK